MAQTKMTNASRVVYDLTEVLLASAGRGYYGIVRVVAEIGSELHKLDPSVTFGVFSQGHGVFFEVLPTARNGGVVDLGVPSGIRQIRIRRRYYGKSLFRDLLLMAALPIVDYRNRRAWRKSGINLKPVDMNNKLLVSCGRPKLLVDILETFDRKGVSCEVVPLLHDVIPLHDVKRRPNGFQKYFLGDNQMILARAKAILTNSEFTKNDILSFSKRGILPKVPEVFMVPLAHECPKGIESSEQTGPEAPYILAVGATLGRKNLEAVFEALRLLKRKALPIPRLVLAGTHRKRTDKFLRSKKGDEIREYVVFRESPNQTDLVNLYENAVALVMASRMEGWGLPAGEALWLGTPAICSTAPVLHEVCGDLGLYFDPDQPDQLADHINRLMTQSSFEWQLRKRIADSKPNLRRWMHVARDANTVLKQLR